MVADRDLLDVARLEQPLVGIEPTQITGAGAWAKLGGLAKRLARRGVIARIGRLARRFVSSAEASTIARASPSRPPPAGVSSTERCLCRSRSRGSGRFPCSTVSARPRPTGEMPSGRYLRVSVRIWTAAKAWEPFPQGAIGRVDDCIIIGAGPPISPATSITSAVPSQHPAARLRIRSCTRIHAGFPNISDRALLTLRML